ncbi:hypothetical protein BJ508DRAFT_334389 [Ascobolus immersus RN42]|uniref:Uncharacterized protein n=1 Tax=Ascobolus immersus RN42 TaxID=1160509 RepID=A0A3N4HTW5_ASCIM|nr:hypothetical protein BJ508DRAFT_334389 [Ascobolus immersus RN42]
MLNSHPPPRSIPPVFSALRPPPPKSILKPTQNPQEKVLVRNIGEVKYEYRKMPGFFVTLSYTAHDTTYRHLRCATATRANSKFQEELKKAASEPVKKSEPKVKFTGAEMLEVECFDKRDYKDPNWM